MPKFVEMDDSSRTNGPFILINQFTVEPQDAEQFLKLWAEDAASMKRQPGFISAQMHKGVGGSRVFLNYAV